ncbi:hypothetical protein [Sphingomonas bacterium]|uniref:hypothetical protein n=1 Tax=Sphingomonas bacterium TaxID=1895847 RepID=UPI0015763026|nr:hypothetical protein [Sphingomonas bacterium]
MTFDPQKMLLAYAGVTTAALAWFLIAAAAPPAKTLGTIDVERINVREPDGTLRMTISDTARAPGIIVKGTEYPHPSRSAAGMLFYNDEGTENGGLIFGGQKTGDKAASYGSLTFDRYHQDQVVQLLGEQDGTERRAGLMVNDQPERQIDYPAIARIVAMPATQRAAAYTAANIGGTPRLFVGRDHDGSSRVALRDGAGRPRLVLRVAADGVTAIDFLGADGKVVRTL